jgi:hypothetical protein
VLGVTAEAASIVDTVKWLPSRYTPVSFWDGQEHYLQRLRPLRQQVRDGVLKLLRQEFGSGATP